MGASDAKDTTKWILQQPWNNGNMIPAGPSAMGIYAFLAASVPMENYAAAYFGIASTSLFEAAYRGGILRQIVVDDIVQILPEEDQAPTIATLRQHEVMATALILSCQQSDECFAEMHCS